MTGLLSTSATAGGRGLSGDWLVCEVWPEAYLTSQKSGPKINVQNPAKTLLLSRCVT